MQDDLKQIKGIGPGTERKLVALGITTFAQLAALDGAERERIDTALNLRGGAEWEEWQPQARELAAETPGEQGSGEVLPATSPDPTGKREPAAGTAAPAGRSALRKFSFRSKISAKTNGTPLSATWC